MRAPDRGHGNATDTHSPPQKKQPCQATVALAYFMPSYQRSADRKCAHVAQSHLNYPRSRRLWSYLLVKEVSEQDPGGSAIFGRAAECEEWEAALPMRYL